MDLFSSSKSLLCLAVMLCGACATPRTLPEMSRDQWVFRPDCWGAPWLLLEDARYNGHDLDGLVLIGSTTAPFSIDESAPDAIRVYHGLEVRQCETGAILKAEPSADVGCLYPGECKPYAIRTGYFFAKEVGLSFFPALPLGRQLSPDLFERLPEPHGPTDCIEFNLDLGAMGKPPVAEIRVRAVKDGQVKMIDVNTCKLIDSSGHKIYRAMGPTK